MHYVQWPRGATCIAFCIHTEIIRSGSYSMDAMTCDQEEGKELCRHPANVDTFLDPVIRKIAPEGSRDNSVECLDEGYSATFRGHPLSSGRLVTVPDGYMGRVLSKRGLERHGEDEVRPY